MKVIFAGGGTGGHLFPGIALADSLPAGSFHFLCTRRDFDAKQLTRKNYPFTPVGKWSVRKGLRLLRQHQADVVVGLGGGGALAGLMAAYFRGIPYVCMEQNVLPGRLNRVASRACRRFYAQFEESRKYLPGLNGEFMWTGSPLRRMERKNPVAARMRYGLSSDWPTILVIGGSQGARALNEDVPDAASWLRERFQFLHLTGRQDRVEKVEKAYRDAAHPAAVLAFESEMEWAYSACDFAISRAGAMALAELCHFQIPALLIPYPHAKDDHQTLNAEVLERAGAARLVPEKKFGEKTLDPWVATLVSGDPIVNNMRRALGALDRPDATSVILADLEERVLQ